MDRIVASRYLSKSARLRDLFIYVTGRVLDDGVSEIREQEVGHKVFGRAPDYDTALDNTVRVHASNLRKRLDQYFAEEGVEEPAIIELPKGNYAPVFRSREVPKVAPPDAFVPPVEIPPRPTVTEHRRTRDWRMSALVALCIALMGVIGFLLYRRGERPGQFAHQPAVRQFWTQVFPPGASTGVILDDAAVGFYQEFTGQTVPLSSYYDRGYLRGLQEDQANPANALVLKRYSSYAAAGLLWRLSALSSLLGNTGSVHFARDYSFGALKSGNIVLLGNSRSNPWVEAFEPKLGIRWKYDGAAGGSYYPVDTLARTPGDHHSDTQEMYATVALVSNTGGTGSVLILSATGGSALNAAGDFLTDEAGVAQLRSKLPGRRDATFPYFETLLRIKPRSRQPKDTSIVIARGVGQ